MLQLLGLLVGRAGVVVLEHLEAGVADEQVQGGVVGGELAGAPGQAEGPRVGATVEVQLGEPGQGADVAAVVREGLLEQALGLGALATASSSSAIVSVAPSTRRRLRRYATNPGFCTSTSWSPAANVVSSGVTPTRTPSTMTSLPC